MSTFAVIFQLAKNVVDVHVFKTSLDGEIFSGGKKCQESNIGDSDNTGDGGKIVSGAIGACSEGIEARRTCLDGKSKVVIVKETNTIKTRQNRIKTRQKGKRGKAGKSQKQLQWVEGEKPKKTQKE
nr:hypothetical protein [Tanacetum cinerariifolium]